MADGRDWISALPPRLEPHRRALAGLLDFSETTPAASSLSVGCSLGRGAADELSDIDAAIGVAAATGPAGASTIREVEASLVEHLHGKQPIDVLREESSSGELFIRRVFAQLSDGIQLDLAVVAEAAVRRGEAAPDFVSLYRTGPDVERAMPSAYVVDAERVRSWAFEGWRALLDGDKYVRRGSPWEAHQRLEEARRHIWALWAAALGTSYPWHGLSQVLDHDPASLPHGIEATVAGLDLEELRSALVASAAVLDDVSAAAAQRCPTELPSALAAFTRAVLTGRRRRTGGA
jgi:predicted nucleotidyltransferase